MQHFFEIYALLHRFKLKIFGEVNDFSTTKMTAILVNLSKFNQRCKISTKCWPLLCQSLTDLTCLIQLTVKFISFVEHSELRLGNWIRSHQDLFEKQISKLPLPRACIQRSNPVAGGSTATSRSCDSQ